MCQGCIFTSVISGISCNVVNEICALLGFYAASIGDLLTALREYLSVPSSSVKQSKKNVGNT
jgi:hypothetical protein